jgi:flagellar P-ring protein precursor FlgI
MVFELLVAKLRNPVQRKSTAWAERLMLMAAMCLFAALPLLGSDSDHEMMLRDITQIEGVRDNQLIGYGLVIGLNRTGDTQQTYFTVQTLANSLSRMGVQISPSTVVVKNVAAVIVTATLPPFSRPGTKLDVSVSSVGDAKSLAGGVLLMTPLRAPNGQVYAMAQGSLLLGGYAEGTNGSSKTVNHVTVGRIAEGAVVERDAAVDLSHFKTVSLLLQNPDFTAARDVAEVINKEFGRTVATTLDSRSVFSSSPDFACSEPFHPFPLAGQGYSERTYRDRRDGRRCEALAGFRDPRQFDHRREDIAHRCPTGAVHERKDGGCDGDNPGGKRSAGAIDSIGRGSERRQTD